MGVAPLDLVLAHLVRDPGQIHPVCRVLRRLIDEQTAAVAVG